MEKIIVGLIKSFTSLFSVVICTMVRIVIEIKRDEKCFACEFFFHCYFLLRMTKDSSWSKIRTKELSSKATHFERKKRVKDWLPIYSDLKYSFLKRKCLIS